MSQDNELMTAMQTRSDDSEQPPVLETVVGRFRWVILGILFCATTINYMDRFLLGVLKPTIMQDLHWSETDYANGVFCFQLAYAVGLLGVSRLIDRIGVRNGLALVVVMCAVASASHSFVSSALLVWSALHRSDLLYDRRPFKELRHDGTDGRLILDDYRFQQRRWRPVQIAHGGNRGLDSQFPLALHARPHHATSSSFELCVSEFSVAFTRRYFGSVRCRSITFHDEFRKHENLSGRRGTMAHCV